MERAFFAFLFSGLEVYGISSPVTFPTSKKKFTLGNTSTKPVGFIQLASNKIGKVPNLSLSWKDTEKTRWQLSRECDPDYGSPKERNSHFRLLVGALRK
ncbi:hypothetical protein AKJ37_05290 [candidate division MSBL1 archaeon SCGC-AAA259I09]|uniref:Uncharacterized protein n=1 Tax=candidate division MSBL1 archaeon SCGC-AAA259I09 TaxID=1698267 RepID=A0A133UQK9_9EURY|nr:hypothetical protein AKJ37_05290 [candidate division MSBL1 archaeon SCGC-AAA259I09]